ncbi:MAG: ATP-dependent DNA helicase RecG [Kofleriaceae bacterium]
MALPTHTLPGIGPAFAERLAEKGLETVEDLLWCLPRRYDDVRNALQLFDVIGMAEGERATFVAKVTSARMVFVGRRRWAEVRVSDLDVRGNAVIRWFNVWAGIDKRMPPGSIVTLSGQVRKREGRLELANPDVLAVEIVDAPLDPWSAPSADGLNPDVPPSPAKPTPAKKPLPKLIARYPDVQGVPASKLRAACQTACMRVGANAEDGVPPKVEQAAGLPALGRTLSMLHSPPDDISADELDLLNKHESIWQRRLVFGELFALGVAVALKRRERCADAAVPCPPAKSLDAELARAFPFELTNAQRTAIEEVKIDLARDAPMNRLLQGDVGSGKTAVAFAAALQAVRAGRQVAIMAPTEILAEQHFETWQRWVAANTSAEIKSRDAGTVDGATAKSAKLNSAASASASGSGSSALMAKSANLNSAASAPLARVAMLTASTPKAVRQSMLAMLAQKQIDILIGTQALLAEGVGFGALGLVIIDEQHRFGVAQRAKLRDKGDGQGAPHLLVMTATPIPRTLALTAYGDLDVSLLDELPPGRLPVKTAHVEGKRGERQAYNLLAQRVAAGERVYVVCPKVEDDNPDSDWKDATTCADELRAAYPSLRIGLVHGRLDIDKRDRTMRAFKVGELDVLVATTVIEVGVDVPEATVMIIHDADRFGLAQLHQLRGRVGRGGAASYCVLVTHGGLTDEGKGRVDAMVQTSDGFLIAETDLALRGPGELCGPRQAGVPRLRYGTLAQHLELLLLARKHATIVLDEDPDLVKPEHSALRAALARRLAQSVYGAESG